MTHELTEAEMIEFLSIHNVPIKTVTVASMPIVYPFLLPGETEVTQDMTIKEAYDLIIEKAALLTHLNQLGRETGFGLLDEE